MIDRREFIVAIGATGLLAACQSGPPKPSVISVNVTGGAGMNPGPGGGDRPVTVLGIGELGGACGAKTFRSWRECRCAPPMR